MSIHFNRQSRQKGEVSNWAGHNWQSLKHGGFSISETVGSTHVWQHHYQAIILTIFASDVEDLEDPVNWSDY